jgi:hypothetical protein
MSKQPPTVQKLYVQPLDIIKAALTHGLSRLTIRRRFMRLNIWTGSFTADETITTVEPNDAGH